MRLRKPRLFDVIRVNGRFHVVMRIENPGGVTLEPLGDVLSRHLLVSRDGEAHRLDDALIDAGWSPPAAGVSPQQPDLGGTAPGAAQCPVAIPTDEGKP